MTATDAARSNLDQALKYNALGWCVIPLRTDKPANRKQARVKWRRYQGERPSEEQVNAWWTKWPDAGVAVILGQVSGIVALDFDGAGADQLAIDNQLPLPPTAISNTGSGGHHFLYRCTELLASETKLLVGEDCHIELRAEGAYIALPPTVHPTGKQYTWANSPEEIMDLPSDVRAMLSAPDEQADHDGDFTINPAAQPPTEKLKTLITNDERFAQTWAHDRPDLSDQSISGFELALANPMAAAAWTDQEIVDALVTFRRAHGDPDKRLPQHQGTYNITLGKAREYAQGLQQAEATEPQAAPDADGKFLYHWTDTGNAERLVTDHGRDIRFCWPWSKWLTWSSKVWEVDAEAHVMHLAKQSVRKLYQSAWATGELDKKLAAFAISSESAARRRALLDLARSEPVVACDHTGFDTDPWLLNCENGTLDLHTGKLRKHRRADYITKLIPIEFDPAATCPRWLRFLDEIFGGNRAITEFIQRAVGYSLTGDVSEDALFFLYGTGANGKTTLLLTLQELLGPYAIEVLSGLLLAQYHEAHPTGLMDLFSTRLAVTVEVAEGRRFDEELLKKLTGGNRIRGRRMREDPWEFAATHKFWLAANDKPRVIGQDYATWRRIKLIPFNVEFTLPGEQGPDVDTSLRKDLFSDEQPGILNWALAGCIDWQTNGLQAPPDVQAATDEYQREEDVIQQFIDSECIVRDDAKVNPTDLYKAFVRWVKDTGARKLTDTTFGRRLTAKGYESGTGREDGPSKRWRYGIGLRIQPTLPDEN